MVAKKADSLYPCVSAASIIAKVTRDTLLEASTPTNAIGDEKSTVDRGSGYPGGNMCIFYWSC